MTKILDDYLEEISHYLGVKDGKDEILEEIRSHILEKSAYFSGTDRHINLKETIREYGPPRKVAENYLEGIHIIHPCFRRFLFRYTWILFFIHYGLKIISGLWGVSFTIMPFGYSTEISGLLPLIGQMPATWIFDFGLTAFLFFIISMNPRHSNPWWPGVVRSVFKPFKLKTRKPLTIGLTIMLFLIFLAGFFMSGTVFFFNPSGMIKPDPVSRPDIFYSLSVLILMITGVEGLTMLLQYRIKSLWISLGNSVFYLVFFLSVQAMPAGKLLPPELMELRPVFSGVFTFVIVFVLLDVVRILRTLFRNHIRLWNPVTE